MARTKAVLGDGARLTDFLSASLMGRVVTPEVVNEVLDAHGRNSQRIRAFPAVAGVYRESESLLVPTSEGSSRPALAEGPAPGEDNRPLPDAPEAARTDTSPEPGPSADAGPPEPGSVSRRSRRPRATRARAPRARRPRPHRLDEPPRQLLR